MRVLPKTLVYPTREPVTLSQLRAQARIEDGADDRVLTGYLVAAREHIEHLLGRPLLPRTMRATLECWPTGPWNYGGSGAGYGGWSTQALTSAQPVIELMVPVMSVDAILYTNTAQTMAQWTGFVARTDSGGVTRIRPQSGGAWPELGLDPIITIDCTAGFTHVPEAISQAICLLAGSFYANREEDVLTLRGGFVQLPTGVTALLAPYRWRWIG